MSVGAYSGKEWVLARERAMARDDNRCQDCGAEDDLHAHHIKPVREFDDESDAHYEDNLVILCKYCHKKWEGRHDRPRLASVGPNLSISELVTDLTYGYIESQFKNLCPTDVYLHYIFYRRDICNTCHSLTGGPPCDVCGHEGAGATNQSLSKQEMTHAAEALADRYEGCGLRFDPDILVKTVRSLMSKHDYTGRQTEIFRAATAVALE